MFLVISICSYTISSYMNGLVCIVFDNIITSMARGGYFWYRWFVCLSVSEQHYSKGYKRIAMNFYGGVWGDIRKN